MSFFLLIQILLWHFVDRGIYHRTEDLLFSHSIAWFSFSTILFLNLTELERPPKLSFHYDSELLDMSVNTKKDAAVIRDSVIKCADLKGSTTMYSDPQVVNSKVSAARVLNTTYLTSFKFFHTVAISVEAMEEALVAREILKYPSSAYRSFTDEHGKSIASAQGIGAKAVFDAMLAVTKACVDNPETNHTSKKTRTCVFLIVVLVVFVTVVVVSTIFFVPYWYWFVFYNLQLYQLFIGSVVIGSVIFFVARTRFRRWTYAFVMSFLLTAAAFQAIITMHSLWRRYAHITSYVMQDAWIFVFFPCIPAAMFLIAPACFMIGEQHLPQYFVNLYGLMDVDMTSEF
uniref:Uncharacterized protein n=1 Tax=Octactis speculum TaxID=3111310 RepID=A0A7S2C5F9_9STRA